MMITNDVRAALTTLHYTLHYTVHIHKDVIIVYILPWPKFHLVVCFWCITLIPLCSGVHSFAIPCSICYYCYCFPIRTVFHPSLRLCTCMNKILYRLWGSYLEIKIERLLMDPQLRQEEERKTKDKVRDALKEELQGTGRKYTSHSEKDTKNNKPIPLYFRLD